MGNSWSAKRSVGGAEADRYDPNSLNPSAPRKATARLASTATKVALGNSTSAPTSKASNPAEMTRKAWLEDPAHRRGQRLRRLAIASCETAARPLSATNRLSLADDVRRKR